MANLQIVRWSQPSDATKWDLAHVHSGKPETFGWLRRPEYDTENGSAYEMPDGRLFLMYGRSNG